MLYLLYLQLGTQSFVHVLYVIITQLRVLITKRFGGNCSSRLTAANFQISLVSLFDAVCLLLTLDYLKFRRASYECFVEKHILKTAFFVESSLHDKLKNKNFYFFYFIRSKYSLPMNIYMRIFIYCFQRETHGQISCHLD